MYVFGSKVMNWSTSGWLKQRSGEKRQYQIGLVVWLDLICNRVIAGLLQWQWFGDIESILEDNTLNDKQMLDKPLTRFRK